MKSILETRPIYHQTDENIRGHVFCSFLALVLRKELDLRLDTAGHAFEWNDIKQDLKSLQEITIEDNGRTMVIRSESLGTCGKVFQAVGVALPPEERKEFLDSLGVAEAAFGRVIRAAFSLLGRISYFTVGEDEVKAWVIPAGAKPPPGDRRDPQRFRAGVHQGRGDRF